MKRIVILTGIALGLSGILHCQAISKTSAVDPDFQNSYAASSQINIQEIQELLVSQLSRAISFRTVSYQDKSKIDYKEFIKFINFLEKTYPAVHKQLQRNRINYSLLYEWKGKTELPPVVLMAHYDVVPADKEAWSVDPFSGTVKDNYLYGRGAIDDKIGVIAILQATEFLLQKNFQPQRTIYLSFGHDEEIGGFEGTKEIVAFLEKQNIKPAFVLDEGGILSLGIVPGTAKPVALVGISEKGYLSLQLTATGKSGHSSMPPEETAITKLVSALERLHRNPFPLKLTPVQEKMLNTLSGEFPFFQKMAMRNLWLFRPFVIKNLASSPTGRASLQTTMVTTILQSGTKENIIPEKAQAIINLRLLPGTTISGAKAYIKKIIDDDSIVIEELPNATEASPIAVTEGEEGFGYRLIQNAVSSIDGNAITVPYLVLGATDSRHYAKLTKNIYRFLPVYLNSEDLSRMHGNDERITIPSLSSAFLFYVSLMENL